MLGPGFGARWRLLSLSADFEQRLVVYIPRIS